MHLPHFILSPILNRCQGGPRWYTACSDWLAAVCPADECSGHNHAAVPKLSVGQESMSHCVLGVTSTPAGKPTSLISSCQDIRACSHTYLNHVV